MKHEEAIADKRLAEIERRNKEREDGPWKFTEFEGGIIAVFSQSGQVNFTQQHHQCGWLGSMKLRNAKFIAHAPDDITDLLLEVKRLRAENEAAQAEITRLKTDLSGEQAAMDTTMDLMFPGGLP